MDQAFANIHRSCKKPPLTATLCKFKLGRQRDTIVPPDMMTREKYDRSCGTQLRKNCYYNLAAEVATNGTFMRGLDKIDNISDLDPGKLHELALVLS